MTDFKAGLNFCAAARSNEASIPLAPPYGYAGCMATESTSDQRKIWQHFQNAAPESFVAAHPRLTFLIGQIARRSTHRVPSVLNIGIGDGFFERQAQSRGWKVHSLDPDEQA